MSETLAHIDQVAAAFLDYVYQNYFDHDQEEWPDRDYGNCTKLNSSPIKCLMASGHTCAIYGLSDEDMDRYGQIGVGHDWLLVDDRWLVDLWAKAYLDAHKVVFDLSIPSDAAMVAKNYGPREHWEKVWPNGRGDAYWKTWIDRSDEDWQQFKPASSQTEALVRRLLD